MSVKQKRSLSLRRQTQTKGGPKIMDTTNQKGQKAKAKTETPSATATPTTPKTTRVRGPKIDDRTFIETWQKGSSVAEVAKTLGVSEIRCSSKATIMRKHGVELRKFPQGGHRKDYSDLAKLAKATAPNS